ncbi:MAG: hypothetical protein WAL63_04225, partial [Solirubrobacteraceae bacterium]
DTGTAVDTAAAGDQQVASSDPAAAGSRTTADDGAAADARGNVAQPGLTEAGVDPATTATPAPADAQPAAATSGDDSSLLPSELDSTFRRRWEEIQTRFVDEPRGAVEDADGLVANVMQQLAEGFAMERERLEGQWGRGEDISTEELRVALQRYRSFFQRLLST